MNVRRIPGMKPHSTVRNLLVGAAYILLPVIMIMALPGILFLVPILVGLSVWKNWFGIASDLENLPGISGAGGLKSGLLVYLYLGISVSMVTIGLNAAIGIVSDTSPEAEVEASGGTTLESDIDAGGESSLGTVRDDPTTEAEPDIPAYSPVKAVDLSYPGQDRVGVHVKLAESRPELTEEEALLIGKDVVESRQQADVVYVQIYQPEGEVGAGACASIEWSEDSGYEVIITRISCTDPEW